MKQYPLAIITPKIGTGSETFICQHIHDILPGNTVCVAVDRASDSKWTTQCPTLILKDIHARAHGPFRMFLRALQWQLGVPEKNAVHAAVKTFLREHKVRVVMGEYMDFSIEYFELLRDMGIRFVVHAHGYDISVRLAQEKWRKEYQKYNAADAVIVVSKSIRSRLIECGLRSEKIFVVSGSATVPCFAPFRRTSGRIRCLMLSRQTPTKGPLLALESFRQAVQRVPELYLDIVGDGPLRSTVMQCVRGFGLSEHVAVHGYLSSSEVRLLVQDADIFVQHSIQDPITFAEEGQPVTLIEMMAQALPIVSTRHAGIPEAVLDGQTGFLVNEGDVTLMAQRIETLARDSQLRKQLGEAGWRRARDYYTWERERHELIDVLGLK